MRDINDKKGGGLMFIYHKQENFELTKESSISDDILIVSGHIFKKKVKIILVYFSVMGKKEDEERNRKIRHEIETELGGGADGFRRL